MEHGDLISNIKKELEVELPKTPEEKKSRFFVAIEKLIAQRDCLAIKYDPNSYEKLKEYNFRIIKILRGES